MSNIVPAIKSEISELEADLLANPDPRVRKLQRLRETLAEYEPTPVPLPPLRRPLMSNLPQTNGNGAVSESQTDDAIFANATKAVKMKLHIGGFLKKHGSTHRKELLGSLIAAGIMGKENDPMQALAIFLSSHKDLFESDGSGNFSLREGAELIRSQ
jgi:hypothetical protein